MKSLSRQEVIKEFSNVVTLYGAPKAGDIFYADQLIAAIASKLCAFDEVNIIFEHGRFNVSPSLSITKEYSLDYIFIGTVKAQDWYTKEQRKAMHEVAFGYEF